MEFRVLRYFLTVAQEGSISKAAEILHVTQPTLSRQLMELEDELGVTLFIRGNRRITLTDEGLIFRRRAKEISALVRKSKAELTTSEIIGGDIYIGGGESDIISVVARCAQSLRDTHPNVRFHFYSGNADDVSERLDKGLLDFGILFEPTNIVKYNAIRLPGVDIWGILMRQDSPLAQHKAIQPEHLWDKPLIVSRQTMVSDVLSGWIGKNYEKLDIVATYNLLYNATHMVREGLGYAMCFDKLANTDADSGLCFRPLDPMNDVGIDVVWKKNQVFSKAASLFLEKIKKYAALKDAR